MTNGADYAFPPPNHHESGRGLTKREHFASNADIPWNAVIDTLLKAGHKDPTIEEVVKYRAKMKVMEAYALIEELNKIV